MTHLHIAAVMNIFFALPIKYAGTTNIYARFTRKFVPREKSAARIPLVSRQNIINPYIIDVNIDRRIINRLTLDCTRGNRGGRGPPRSPAAFFGCIKLRAIFHCAFAANGIEKLPAPYSRRYINLNEKSVLRNIESGLRSKDSIR